MISGIYFTGSDNQATASRFHALRERFAKSSIFSDERLLLTDHQDELIMGPGHHEENDPKIKFFSDDQVVSCTTGTPANAHELRAEMSLAGQCSDAELFGRLYIRHGLACSEHVRGGFSFMIYNRLEHTLLLGRDHFGIEPLYYCMEDGLLLFSSTVNGVITLRQTSPELHHPALSRILLFNYNVGNQTLVTGIRRLPAAHQLQIKKGGEPQLTRYWKLRFMPQERPESTITEELRSQLRTAVSDSLHNTKSTGVFLSGGMDSSTILALSSEKPGMSLNTFSYRCRAASFDESHYARIMANFAGTNHHECDYSANDVLLMPEVVAGMNEPFCDVGINIATYLLGQEAASAGERLILTGDGGDELFAGHPVYEADKIARYFDTVPRPLLIPLLALLKKLPDSDQKKNLAVKLKRFSESLAYPKELLSHRWRAYYDAADMGNILSAELSSELNYAELLEDILTINQENSGPDMLSDSLYSDYQTVVDFYLRRNDLIRRFGIEVRYPMFDPRLVEFCAGLPSSMKIHGWFDTKYIFKKAMEPVLPHEIIYRKDKLGHSIPLKNWIRDDSRVREMILDHISEESLARRNLFNPKAVTTLINEHMRKQRNNSHRLWTLAVIEMWLRHNMDNRTP